MSQPTPPPANPLELTAKAIILGVLLSVILAGANAYLGLFAGMTVSASIPAAVVSLGILRLFRKHGILENNLVQTAASAGESLAAGVIFTLPALVILNVWSDFSYLKVTLIAGFGGLLGVLFTIPLRRALITTNALKYPEGVATAEVLRSGSSGGKGIRPLAIASLLGGLFKFAQSGLRLIPAATEAAGRVGGSLLYFGGDLSPALLSVGYIVGLNIAVLIFLGGIANWLVAIPMLIATGPWPAAPDGTALAAVDAAHLLWSTKTRYIGVGAMVIGGLWTILHLRKPLLEGVRSGLAAYRHLKSSKSQTVDRTERDLPMPLILALIAFSVVPLFILYQLFLHNLPASITAAVVMLIAGFLFSAVAGYMAGLVGSSNNPISGVTIATVLFASLLLLALLGKDAPNGPAGAIIVGAVVCCAAAIAGDNMQDLKAGQLVGATPAKQQFMQIVGVVSAAFVMAPILSLLYKAYGFAGHASAKGDSALAAVQANLMASVAAGVFQGQLPWLFIVVGAFLAVGIIALDCTLQRRGASFRTPVLAVAIGFYLPLELATPIFLGGLIHYALHRPRRTKQPASANASDEHAMPSDTKQGLLFAAGLITGEALMGILLAIPIVLTRDLNVFSLTGNAPLGPLATAAGIAALIFVAGCLIRAARVQRR